MSEQQINSINNYLTDALKAHNITVEGEENGWINFPRRNDAPFYAYQSRQPKIRGDVVQRMQHPQNLVIQIDILVQLLDGRILCESFAGIGEDEKSAIENGLANFLNSSFHVLANAFYFQKDEQVTTEMWEINGERWRVFLGNLVERGEISDNFIQVPEDVYPIFESLIKSQRLQEDCHWFNWFYANLEHKTTQCEALFDNQVWKEASNKVKNCNWEKRKEYYTFRNFIVLVNEDYYTLKSFVLDSNNRNDFSDRLVGMQLKSLVGTAVELIKKHKDLEDFDLLKTFVSNGITKNIAQRLIEFVPLAFGRVFLDSMDANLNDYYERLNENGKVIESKKLFDVSIYSEAFRLAKQEIEIDYNKDDFVAVAWRSPEMQATNELLNKGSKIENIVFTPPTFLWADELQEDYYIAKKKQIELKNAENSNDEKSWWQIWK